MSKETLNTIPSLQARLKNKAQKINKTFQEVLQHYGMERFLYRLSKTKYADYFILKGGLMFYSLDIPLRRPTKDIDFLCRISKEDIYQVFTEVLSTPVPDDCVIFDIRTFSILETQIDADHHGVRTKFIGYLGKMKIYMQVDIGFSDEIASSAVNITYPTLLPEHAKPKIKGYPPESIISEKFHAMTRFGKLNSRWKDYFDIWLLLYTFEFESDRLEKAIKKTFEKRSTIIPSTRPTSLTTSFADANDKNWKIFLRRSKLKIDSVNELKDVVEMIWSFLEFPLQSLAPNAKVNKRSWIPTKGWM